MPAKGEVEELVRQHVIDPEICTACMSCMTVCPASAIVERAGVMAIDFSRCDGLGACLEECATGAIEAWIEVPEGEAFSVEEQLGWRQLPAAAGARMDLASSQERW